MVLFVGDITKNNGPSNVNKQLHKYLKNDIKFIVCKNKIIFAISVICSTIFADTIIYSGLLKIDKISLKIASVLKKRIFYLMHGCVQYEQVEINKTDPMGGEVLEKQMFYAADKILCVSEPFAQWFKKYRPEYADKVNVLTNGVPWDEMEGNISHVEDSKSSVIHKDVNKIILLGGGRRTKGNLYTIEAIQKLNLERTFDKLEVHVYGYKRQDDDSEEIVKYDFVQFKGMVSHDELMLQFKEAVLFVQNSLFEPFSLACIEAIMNDCAVLLSSNVGCGSIMTLQETDVIKKCDDIDEIASKIDFLLQQNNARRLMNSIDREKSSCKMSAILLKEYLK